MDMSASSRMENLTRATRQTLSEAAMPDLVSKPAHRIENADTHFEPLLDTDEAAALLKIHPKTLQQMARSGRILGVRIGKLWRFRASVLNDWLEHKMAS